MSVHHAGGATDDGTTHRPDNHEGPSTETTGCGDAGRHTSRCPRCPRDRQRQLTYMSVCGTISHMTERLNDWTLAMACASRCLPSFPRSGTGCGTLATPSWQRVVPRFD